MGIEPIKVPILVQILAQYAQTAINTEAITNQTRRTKTPVNLLATLYESALADHSH